MPCLHLVSLHVARPDRAYSTRNVVFDAMFTAVRPQSEA